MLLIYVNSCIVQLRLMFIFVTLFYLSPLVYGNSCKAIFTPYAVPPGFNQGIYDQTMLIYDNLSVSELTHINPASSLSQAEKSHLVSLVMSASRLLEKNDNINQILQLLPERQRDTFEKIVTLFLSAKQGTLTEINDFLEQLLQSGKYEAWFEFVAKLHQEIPKMSSIPPVGLETIQISESIRDFYAFTGFVIHSDPSQNSYVRFTQPLPWFSNQSLTKHFIKRTQRDGYPMLQEKELLDAANKFILSSRPGQIVFLRSDGTYVVYDPTTKELAVVSGDNRIITYYILSPRYNRPEDLAAYMKYVFMDPPPRN